MSYHQSYFEEVKIVRHNAILVIYFSSLKSIKYKYSAAFYSSPRFTAEIKLRNRFDLFSSKKNNMKLIEVGTSLTEMTLLYFINVNVTETIILNVTS